MLRFKALVIVSAVALAMGMAVLAQAQGVSPTKAMAEAVEKAPAPRLSGTWPDPIPNVTLDLEDESVGSALSELADKAGWSLAFTGSSAAAGQEITLKVQNRPATEALKVLLDAADLEAKLNGGILVVKAKNGADTNVDGTVQLPMGDIKVKIKAGDGSELDSTHFKFKHKKQHKDDRVVVGSSGSVGVDEAVGDAVAVGGSMTVQGHVHGDAVAVGGSVVLEPTASVDGDAVAIGGEVDVEDGATLKGNRVSIGGSLGGLVSGLANMGMRHSLIPSFVFGILSTILRALVLLVLGLLLLAFMPERIENVREFLRLRPGHSTLAGLGLLLGILPFCLLLVVTIVGIPLVPVALLILAAMMVIGSTAFSVWLGYRLPILQAKKTPVMAMLVGLGLCTLVDLIPLVGSAILAIVAFAAAGATLLSRFGKNRPEGAATPPAPAA